jgi:hypothetical protein
VALRDILAANNDGEIVAGRPLPAIADLAGGEWPERARRAALALSGSGSEPRDSVREQLLRLHLGSSPG